MKHLAACPRAAALLASLLLALPAAAAPAVIPVELPPAAATPPAKDKPVKVYILSGQSNMVGFGAIEKAGMIYENVFLSADASAKVSSLPVANAALVKFGVYQSIAPDAPAGAIAAVFQGAYDAKIDYSKVKPAKLGSVALGQTDAQLPSIDGPHTVVVNGFLEVPYDGNYELHAGFEASGQCTATLEGKEIYRKDGTAAAVLTKVTLKARQRYPLSIVYQQGGSAALWLQKVDLAGMGNLRWVVGDLGRFRYLLADDAQWAVRNDVILNDAYLGKGSSAPHSVTACGPTFGPELGFGFVMGTFHDEPVLVIKACEGNRSLGWDILPPGSEGYEFEGKKYPGYGETVDAAGNIVKPGPKDWYAGKQYDDFTTSIRAVLDNFGERYPEYKDQGYEVAGFVWWQGHKDGGSPAHIARYEENLANLIKAWRKEFNAPNAKWAIATVGFHGKDMVENYQKIAAAQLAVADPQRHPEFAGTVKTIDTRPFWRDPEFSPKNQDYHYNHNAETYMLAGDALGRAMAELHGAKAEYPEGGMIKEIAAVPFMQAVGEAELAEMRPALRPIIMDKLLPEFAGNASEIPSYLRRGLALGEILAARKLAKPTSILASQLDQMIRYYQLCGISDYDWKPFGPEMRTAEWSYLTFDPAEKKGDFEGDRYREVTLPKGAENWFAMDFDAAKAGWKTAAAPFGQNDGKPEALRTDCGIPHCHCDTLPGALWDKEILLMRQSFEVPKLDPNFRYRIVVGGAGHPWSGEGFALYLNGKLVGEEKGGYYKSGGDARGAFVFEDLAPEFASGKITIAVKSFLRQNGFRGKQAAPSGHLSAWVESAKLSPLALELAAKPAQ
jgi:Carbohydrate esterase, sialic acid-specific acetylesterase